MSMHIFDLLLAAADELEEEEAPEYRRRSFHGAAEETRVNVANPDSLKGHYRAGLKDISNHPPIVDRSASLLSQPELELTIDENRNNLPTLRATPRIDYYHNNKRESTLSSQSERKNAADQNYWHGRVQGPRANAGHADHTPSSQSGREKAVDENRSQSFSQASRAGHVMAPRANGSDVDQNLSSQSGREKASYENRSQSLSHASWPLVRRSQSSSRASRAGRVLASQAGSDVDHTMSFQSRRGKAADENRSNSSSHASRAGRFLGLQANAGHADHTPSSQSGRDKAADGNRSQSFSQTSRAGHVMAPRANGSDVDQNLSSQSGREKASYENRSQSLSHASWPLVRRSQSSNRASLAAAENRSNSSSYASRAGRVLGLRDNAGHVNHTPSSQSGREKAADENRNQSSSHASRAGRILGPRANGSDVDHTMSYQSGRDTASEENRSHSSSRAGRVKGPQDNGSNVNHTLSSQSGPWANLTHPDISNSPTISSPNSNRPSSRSSNVFNNSAKWEEAPSFQRVEASTPLSNASFALNLSWDGNYSQTIPDSPLNLVVNKMETPSFAAYNRAPVVLDLRVEKTEPQNASAAPITEKKSEIHHSLPSGLYTPSNSTRRHMVLNDHDGYCKKKKFSSDVDIDQLSQPNTKDVGANIIENNVELSELESEHDYTDDDDDPEWMPDGDASQLNDLTIYEYFEKFKTDILSERESDTSSAGEQDVGAQTDDEEPQESKSKMRKRNRIRKEKGFTYKRMDGTVVPARRVKPPCECRMRCYDKFPESVRQNLLSQLLALSQSGQNQFLSSHITVMNTVRPKVLVSRRTRSRFYRLPGVGDPVKVCKRMFMATFDLKDRKVRTLANKLVLGQGIASDDMRKGNCSQKQVSPEHADYIMKHIKSFPAEESHYGREKSSRLYLSSDLNVQRMYELYQDQCGGDNLTPVHYNTYRRAFNSLNLKFRKPKIDTCNTCDMFKIELQVEKDERKRKEIIVRKDAHHLEAQRIYSEKRDDKKRAEQDMSVRTISFDLQKQLATPYLTCGRAFYSRQLYTYNLTIYETQIDGNIPVCYIWDETRAKRGSKEIGSCLWHYFKGLPACVEEVIMYSDRCAGQNNNRTVLFIMAYVTELAAADGRKLSICHKFMASGHSHMECDTIHSAIERAKKRTQVNIETPHDWTLFISSIRRSPPIIVKDMEQRDFFDFSVLESRYTVPKCTINNETFKFKEARVFLCSSESPGLVQFKKDVGDNDFQCIKLLTTTTVALKHIQLKPILTKPIVLPTAKLEDLRRLLPFVSQKWYYEAFLKSLAPPGRGRKPRNTDCDNFDADFDYECVND